MALVFNGVTIPTNVANALSFNGTNITKVIADGVTVWTQNLFKGQWSGSSIARVNNNTYGGIRLLPSGTNFRLAIEDSSNLYYTEYTSVLTNGTFNGGLMPENNPYPPKPVIGTTETRQLTRNGQASNTFSLRYYAITSQGAVTNTVRGGLGFKVSDKSFYAVRSDLGLPCEISVRSGGVGSGVAYFEISGKQVRAYSVKLSSSNAGAWITLN